MRVPPRLVISKLTSIAGASPASRYSRSLVWLHFGGSLSWDLAQLLPSVPHLSCSPGESEQGQSGGESEELDSPQLRPRRAAA